MKTEIKKLESTDLDQFIELIRIFEEVFEMKNFNLPPHAHLQLLLERNDFMVFVACCDGKVIGGLTTYTLTQYYSARPLVYIYDLGVAASHQRQGVGKLLIEELSAFCKAGSVEEIFVQADEPDLHALDFYRSTGAIAEKVVHFYYPLNKD